MTQPDSDRRRSQSDEILRILREAGERGVTNVELWTVAHAAHSRIADLRARGHRIRCERKAPGIYLYTLETAAGCASAAFESPATKQPPEAPAKVDEWNSRPRATGLELFGAAVRR